MKLKTLFITILIIATTTFLRVPISDVNGTPVEILSHSYYVDMGYSYVVGEVENVGNQNLEYVRITITFYDSSDNVISTSFSFTELTTLKLGEKSPFQVTSFPDSNLAVDDYKLQVSDYSPTSASPYRSLKIQGVTASTQYGYYTVRGEVENEGSIDSTYVKVIATFYDQEGTVIGTSFTFVDADTLRGGQTSPFELSTYPQTITPASYDLQVECSEYMPSTSISCSLSKNTLTIGESLSITGSISPAVPDAEINLKFTDPDSTQLSEIVTSGSDGSYSFSYEPSILGDWSVYAIWEGDLTYGGSSSQIKSFRVSEPPKTGSLTITVNDQDGHPLSGVSVSSTSQPDEQSKLSGTTGTDGSFTFVDVLAGSYNLQMTKTNYDTITGTINVEEDITASQTYQMQEQICSITITVEDEDGNTLSGAEVSSTSYPGGQTKLADETLNGEVTFTNIKPSIYTFEATLSGYRKQSKSIELSTGDEANLKLTLEKIQETQQEETSDGNGIPGFPLEALVIGLIIMTFIWSSKKSLFFSKMKF